MLFPRKSRNRASVQEDGATDNALFIQEVIHDIRGDFLGVAGVCQSMKKGLEEKKDIAGLLDILLENCRTYKYKMANFLEFTRLQAGLRRTMRDPVQIRQLLNKVIDEYDYLWIDREARITLDISDDLPAEISCDEDRIMLMVVNLFVNAINFSPSGSTISIKAGRRGKDRWTLSVQDNGKGMTDQQLEAIFADAPARRKVLHNSAGLGLIVTRWLTEDVLGGKFQLTSRPASGTTALLDFPFHPE
jgi:signal transduction histidine kinase